MFKCIFIKRKLYDYATGDISENSKVLVKNHVANCPSCSRILERISGLINAVENKGTLKPPEDFWHDFGTELDAKLNARLAVGSGVYVPIRKPRPAFALALVSVIILFLGIYFYSSFSSINKSASALSGEMALLEEVDPSISFVNDEDSLADEFQLLYQFTQNPA